MKIKVRALPASLLVLSYTRLYINSFYSVYIVCRILILCGLFLYCIKSINKINFSTLVAFLIFTLVAVGSTAANKGGVIKMVQCTVFFVTILCTYLVVEWYKLRSNEHLFIKSVFYTLLILCCICDIVALGQRGADYYLLGTKFMVSYIHLLIIFLCQVLYRMKSIGKKCIKRCWWYFWLNRYSCFSGSDVRLQFFYFHLQYLRCSVRVRYERCYRNEIY